MKEDAEDKIHDMDENLDKENLTDNQTEVQDEAPENDNVTDWEAKFNELQNSYLRLNA